MEVRKSAVILPRGSSSFWGEPSRQQKLATPWADLPKELQGGYRSLSNCDFCERVPYDKAGTTLLTSEEIKAQWIAELRRRKAEEDERSFAQKRAESRMEDEKLAKKFAPVDFVNVYDHRGVTTRSVSAPIDDFYERLDKISEREHFRREQVPSFAAPTLAPSPEIADSFNTVSYWYPSDKQRLKYRVLEEVRLAAARVELVDNGWASRGKPGGPDKKVTDPDKVRLSADEEAWLEEQWALYVEQQKVEQAAAAEMERRFEEEAALPAAVERRLQPKSDVGQTSGAVVAPFGDLPIRSSVPRQSEVFRAELPAARLPKRFQLPKKDDSVPAPPWGRQTEEEERWKKRAQFALDQLRKEEEALLARGAITSGVGSGNATQRRSILRPLVKGDVDRELKTVRDGGLLKRPKQSVLKRISQETAAFVKSLPKDFGKTHHAPKPMHPVPTPGAASLH